MKQVSLFLPLLTLGFCNPSSQQVATPKIEALVLPSPAYPFTGQFPPNEKMHGLTFVAPPEPFPVNPMPHVKEVGASWISVVPYAFTRLDVPNVRFIEHSGQWWGERPEGVRETIHAAHEHGIKVMVKPQVYVPYGWTGALNFKTDEDWEKWEAAYERYILRFAALADSTGAELFCIGTEFNNAIQQRPRFWTHLIKKIKSVYRGKLTYSSNWDDWERVPFWGELDYIGLGGYFPLVDAVTPEVEQLKIAWKPIQERLKKLSQEKGKPVLFTEFGYLSVDGCGWRNWELERGIESRNINEQAQANCLEALFATFQPEDWWAGGFLWKWFPNMRGHEGYPERDYTPQGKLGEAVLKKWYK
ncbi:MAG: hypothetical protein Q7T20_06085 [Saprospiraceae bacterium]|nr:hypothetical protein [Saprospiraceae bacterium]